MEWDAWATTPGGDIHTIGVRLVEVAHHGARFAVLKNTPDCKRLSEKTGHEWDLKPSPLICKPCAQYIYIHTLI